MDKVNIVTTEPNNNINRLPSTSSQSNSESINLIIDNTNPPAYHELHIVPHPFMPESQMLHTVPFSPGLNLEIIGVPLSNYGDIHQVIYGNREAEQYSFFCCCCQDPYLYIPDNFVLNLADHKIVGILCPKCKTGIIKLGILRDSCDEQRIHVCLHCKTVYPRLPR